MLSRIIAIVFCAHVLNAAAQDFLAQKLLQRQAAKQPRNSTFDNTLATKKCSLVDTVCTELIDDMGSHVTEADCILEDAEITLFCEAAGFGPEDPLADTCVAAIVTGWQAACGAAVKAGTEVTQSACIQDSGCAAPASCSGGNDNDCQSGLHCGRFDNDPNSYQCCASTKEVSGVWWCANPQSGKCSDGNDNNCQSGLYCGRYDDKMNYQCCSSKRDIDGVSWCASPEGGMCSDGNDNNCQLGLSCGRYDDQMDYQCCASARAIGAVSWCASPEGGMCSDGNDNNCQLGLHCGRYDDKMNYKCCASAKDTSGVWWCA